MSLALKKTAGQTPHRQDDGLNIPEFLRIPQEGRRKAWEQYKPTQTASSHNQERRYLSETKDQYEKRLALEHPGHNSSRVDYTFCKTLDQALAEPEVEPFTAKTHLLGFNFVEFLKRRNFIGQIYPWKDTRPPMLALLVPLQTALDECIEWTTAHQFIEDANEEVEEIIPTRFRKYLKDNNIFLGTNINDFVKAKEEYNKNRTIEEKEEIEMTPRLKKLLEQLDISDSRVKYKRDGTPLTGIDRAVIHGKNGYIFEDETETKKMHVFVTDQKEQWNAIKKKLSFMRLNENEDQTGGHFTLNRDLTPKEAGAIRKAVGLKKKPQLTDEYRGSLKNRLPKDHAPSQVAFSMGG